MTEALCAYVTCFAPVEFVLTLRSVSRLPPAAAAAVRYTHEYGEKKERFNFSLFLVFFQCIGNAIFALARTKEEGDTHGALLRASAASQSAADRGPRRNWGPSQRRSSAGRHDLPLPCDVMHHSHTCSRSPPSPPLQSAPFSPLLRLRMVRSRLRLRQPTS